MQSVDQGSNGRTVSRCWHTQDARRQRDHGDRFTGHVEEFDRVPFLGDTGHGVPLHDCSDIARTESAL